MRWKSFNRFMTGNEICGTLKFRELFSETFKNHKKKEEAIITQNIDFHPKPWKWLRVFLFLTTLSIISFVNVLVVGVFAFPWLVLIFSAVIPVTVAVFLNEIVLQEKFSLLDISLAFLIGTTIAFLAVGILNTNTGDVRLNMVLIAPIIEEIAKLIPIVIAIRVLKVKRISSALFIGWIIGSGFQIAETVGYSTYLGYMGIFSQIEFHPSSYEFVGSLDYSTMFLRSLLAFGSHAFWGAIEAAALLFAKKANNNKLKIGRFFIWFLFCIVMHMIWNSIATYTTSVGLGYTLLVIVQLLYFPLFYYLVDTGISDQRSYLETIEKDIVTITEPTVENID